MENPPSTQPGGTEKPAAARLSTPAQPAQQQFQPLESLPTRAPTFQTSKPFSIAKLVLGSFNLVFAIIALGLSLGLIMSTVTFSSFIGIAICLSLAVVSLIWQLAEHITLAVRKGWRPIHPGAHVGVHLLLSVLALLVAMSLCFAVADELAWYNIDPDCTYDADWPINDYTMDGRPTCDMYTFPTQADADKYFRMIEALAAFSVLMLISHVTLFIMACVETDRRRKYGKMTKVVYLVASQGPADGRTYYAPVGTQLFDHRTSVLPPQAAFQQQQRQHQHSNADPGIHGYYAPPAGVAPGTAA
ncbi:hypothetical protein KVR01_009197 [Diaporthe batatas]|uniref:uncharacterized protein n=1 Tax=Diaporthe batatas TaxID=748121 RepID=UPI001D038590|nr:uncharacterized protein KVR01_009197 [Diaporthe batatas]KAG8160933.1 hypothetical protein KVR01_009197 [Diaporthe batatas]